MTTISRRVPPQGLINVANPAVRALLRSPMHAALDKALLVLHIVGRRTGRHYDIPVGYLQLDGDLVAITEHAWRANVRGGADIEITIRGHRRRMHCILDEDPTTVAATLHRVLGRLGPTALERLTGLTLPDESATGIGQLEAAVREFGLTTLTLTPATGPVVRS